MLQKRWPDKVAPSLFCLTLLLTGCGGKLWPFKSEDESSKSPAPANSTEYRCAANKHFYVRYLDKGETAWLIYPDREISLAQAADGKRYSNGIAVLEFTGDEATLNDGPTLSYTGCKAVAAAK